MIVSLMKAQQEQQAAQLAGFGAGFDGANVVPKAKPKGKAASSDSAEGGFLGLPQGKYHWEPLNPKATHIRELPKSFCIEIAFQAGVPGYTSQACYKIRTCTRIKIIRRNKQKNEIEHIITIENKNITLRNKKILSNRITHFAGLLVGKRPVECLGVPGRLGRPVGRRQRHDDSSEYEEEPGPPCRGSSMPHGRPELVLTEGLYGLPDLIDNIAK